MTILGMSRELHGYEPKIKHGLRHDHGRAHNVHVSRPGIEVTRSIHCSRKNRLGYMGMRPGLDMSMRPGLYCGKKKMRR